MLKLVIGNRNYSSWSLRAWLYLTESGVPFDELRIPMFTKGWKDAVRQYSPSGRVPVLLDEGLSVWDTMAIFETVQERFPEAIGWPDEASGRALARSIAYEMHSGFLAVRDELPQNLRIRNPLDPAELSPTCQEQIERIDDIWSECHERSGGPWLFGDLSIADIMYIPVALRFLTYGIPVSPAARSFIDTAQTLGSLEVWVDMARQEPESITFIDDLIPASQSDLTLG